MSHFKTQTIFQPEYWWLEKVKTFRFISLEEVKGRWSSTYQCAASVMQDWDCRIYRSRLQLVIFIGHSEVLPIDCKRESSFVHVEEDAKHTLSFENSTIARSLGIWIVAQLANAEKSPAKVIVAEGSSLVALLRLTDTNFQLMLRFGISHELPVMDPFSETDITEEGSEKVVLFFKEDASLVIADV